MSRFAKVDVQFDTSYYMRGLVSSMLGSAVRNPVTACVIASGVAAMSAFTLYCYYYLLSSFFSAKPHKSHVVEKAHETQSTVQGNIDQKTEQNNVLEEHINPANWNEVVAELHKVNAELTKVKRKIHWQNIKVCAAAFISAGCLLGAPFVKMYAEIELILPNCAKNYNKGFFRSESGEFIPYYEVSQCIMYSKEYDPYNNIISMLTVSSIACGLYALYEHRIARKLQNNYNFCVDALRVPVSQILSNAASNKENVDSKTTDVSKGLSL